MKTPLLLLAFLALPVVPLSSQTTPASAPTPPPPSPSQADLRRATERLSAKQLEAMVIYQMTLADRIVGVLPRLQRADNPLQLISPFAPARHGSGYDNLSLDPRTGRHEGIVFLSIKF